MTDSIALNKGLELALEWGENYGKTIARRLARLYPKFWEGELRNCEIICQEAKHFAFGSVFELYEKGHKDPSSKQYDRPVLTKCPWMSNENLSRLLTQGRYYAWRDFS